MTILVTIPLSVHPLRRSRAPRAGVPPPEPGASVDAQPSAEAMAEMRQSMTDSADALQAAGVMVSVEMLPRHRQPSR